MPNSFSIPTTLGIYPSPVDWNLSYSAEFQSVKTDNSYARIPLIVIPFLMRTKVIALSVNSESAKSGWIKAGSLSQKVRTGLLVGGNYQEQIDWRFLPLGSSIHILSKWDGEYSLEILPARHLKHLSVTLFEPRN